MTSSSSMAANNAGRMLRLRSCDGAVFETEVTTMALQSGTINKRMLEEILWRVLQFCNIHSPSAAKSVDDLRAFDAYFIDVDLDTLFNLALAAHYLDITKLVDLISKTIAGMIGELTLEQIRILFKLKEDFTEEETEEIKRKYPWASLLD